jgi:hypothetical protein
MDDERLKNPPGPGHHDYFDELLERIRETPASERRFYQKVLDVYATSIDYKPGHSPSAVRLGDDEVYEGVGDLGHVDNEILLARIDAAASGFIEYRRIRGIVSWLRSKRSWESMLS